MKSGVLVVPEEFATHFREAAPRGEISGLLNWSPAMGWDLKTINEDLTDYRYYLLNFSSTELEYGNVIKQIEPSSILIGMFDYGMSALSQYFANLERIRENMKKLDFVMSVNANQKKWMELVLPGKPIHYVPHPANLDLMRTFRKKAEDRNQGIGVMWHQYSDSSLLALEVLKAVERKLKHPIQKTLIGLKSRIIMERGLSFLSEGIPVIDPNYPDERLRGQPLDPDMPKYMQRCPPGVSWSSLLPYMSPEPWYDALSRFAVCLDMYATHSIGRFGIDCAGVQVPLVASSMQDSSSQLWPFSKCDPFDPEPWVNYTVKLLKDDEFREKCLRTADKNLEFYSFKKSRERMLRMLEET